MGNLKQAIKSILLDTFPKLAKRYLFREQSKFSWNTVHEINNEPEVLILEAFFARHPHFYFFDVGANKGEYLFAAEKFLSPQHIHAFEPNPKLFKRLSKIFPTIHLHEVALSHTNEMATFKIPTVNGHEDDTLGSLETTGKLENETSFQLVEVKCQTLDSIIREHVSRVDCIKIDVEGFELGVLKGAKHTIADNFPLMLIEIEGRHHSSKNVLQLIEEIKAFAPFGKEYKVFYFDSTANRIKVVEESPAQSKKDWGTRKYINNFLFVPAGSEYMNEIENINFQLEQLFEHN